MDTPKENEGLLPEMHYFICPQCRSQLFQPIKLLEQLVDESRAERFLAEFSKNKKYPAIKENEIESIAYSMTNHLRLQKEWEKTKTKKNEGKTKTED